MSCMVCPALSWRPLQRSPGAAISLARADLSIVTSSQARRLALLLHVVLESAPEHAQSCLISWQLISSGLPPSSQATQIPMQGRPVAAPCTSSSSSSRPCCSSWLPAPPTRLPATAAAGPTPAACMGCRPACRLQLTGPQPAWPTAAPQWLPWLLWLAHRSSSREACLWALWRQCATVGMPPAVGRPQGTCMDPA